MKTRNVNLFVLAGLFALTSCTDDDSQSTNNPVNVQPVIDAVAGGEWTITNYVDSGSDHTGQFTGVAFTFGADNTITANTATAIYTGSWSVTNDSSSGSDDDSSDDDDSGSNDIDFNISFASPANYAELSDDWDIVSYSPTKIELIDISGGNGGTDYLTFEKN